MEGVGARPFRKAIATIGGFDEACTEFLRVPSNAHVASLSRKYDPLDTAPIPQAAQIMGSIPHLMADMTQALIERGAHRVDLNCGCPSNTVTGRGAGSSLLKTPDLLYEIVKAMKDRATVPISVKLRSGYEDTTLFEENILAAQEGGASFVTLHPRTKVEGYKPPAKWEYIKRAKELLNIPVVGNGDINSVEDALAMLEQTGCDALMTGRRAVIDPWIFHKIKGHFKKPYLPTNWEDTENYIRCFYNFLETDRDKSKINQLKQIASFLFQKTKEMEEVKLSLLKQRDLHSSEFLESFIKLYKGCFFMQDEIKKLTNANITIQNTI